MKIERRAFNFDFIESHVEAPRPIIVGHAAVFDQTADLFFFMERIERGAFRQSISEDDVRALFNHNPDLILGRNKAGTLTLAEDAVGLAVQITPPDTNWADDLLVSMRRGDITQMSFAFEVMESAWEKADGEDVRVLKRVKLWDVSPVTFPAYDQTDAQVRSAKQIFEEFSGSILPEIPVGHTAPPANAGGVVRINLLRKRLGIAARQ